MPKAAFPRQTAAQPAIDWHRHRPGATVPLLRDDLPVPRGIRHPPHPPPDGRGSRLNPANRFARLHVEVDEDAWTDDDPRPLRTEFLRDDSQTILVRNDADDLPFELSLNPYRGCEHGCAYCYARTYHEYLGFSAGLDFEAKIVVKQRAPELLEMALARPGYRPAALTMSGVTDCYQPVERRLEITRRCLEVLARCRHPVVVITKNALVTRDLDHLVELARYQAAAVYLSITTLDRELARELEPRASTPAARLEAVRTLAAAGVPVGVSAAPMIPGLNDAELAAILAAGAGAGASFAMYSVVRLPGAVRTVFDDWLARTRPQAKAKILGRIAACHGGRLNDREPGRRMSGGGAIAAALAAMFEAVRRKHGLAAGAPELSTAAFRRMLPGQGDLF